MKFSLSAQISEVEYELAQRASVYPRIAGNHPSRASELELHTERMKAVLATLDWLRENETDVVAWLKEKKQAVAELGEGAARAAHEASAE
jgi:hypothetical protein